MHMIYPMMRFLLACYFNFLNYMIFNDLYVKRFIGLLFIQMVNVGNMAFSRLYDMNILTDAVYERM
ncbi:hypothetical protein C5471_07635 [Photorhabdus tasmaniensis]|uniref:Uncharacterized protein n=1 Tax=Photorhabdus tasmaniensis TaxID=1004159 RepID=A0ABX0GER9_9GAMM|nr:hypothetical protein [Photorhabdus tasmaniensis]